MPQPARFVEDLICNALLRATAAEASVLVDAESAPQQPVNSVRKKRMRVDRLLSPRTRAGDLIVLLADAAHRMLAFVPAALLDALTDAESGCIGSAGELSGKVALVNAALHTCTRVAGAEGDAVGDQRGAAWPPRAAGRAEPTFCLCVESMHLELDNDSSQWPPTAAIASSARVIAALPRADAVELGSGGGSSGSGGQLSWGAVYRAASRLEALDRWLAAWNPLVLSSSGVPHYAFRSAGSAGCAGAGAGSLPDPHNPVGSAGDLCVGAEQRRLGRIVWRELASEAQPGADAMAADGTPCEAPEQARGGSRSSDGERCWAKAAGAVNWCGEREVAPCTQNEGHRTEANCDWAAENTHAQMLGGPTAHLSLSAGAQSQSTAAQCPAGDSEPSRPGDVFEPTPPPSDDETATSPRAPKLGRTERASIAGPDQHAAPPDAGLQRTASLSWYRDRQREAAADEGVVGADSTLRPSQLSLSEEIAVADLGGGISRQPSASCGGLDRLPSEYEEEAWADDSGGPQVPLPQLVGLGLAEDLDALRAECAELEWGNARTRGLLLLCHDEFPVLARTAANVRAGVAEVHAVPEARQLLASPEAADDDDED